MDQATGGVSIPIYQSSTFALESARAGAEIFAGEREGMFIPEVVHINFLWRHYPGMTLMFIRRQNISVLMVIRLPAWLLEKRLY